MEEKGVPLCVGKGRLDVFHCVVGCHGKRCEYPYHVAYMGGVAQTQCSVINDSP